MIRRTLSRLLDDLNARRGLSLGHLGYTYVADIHGDGSNRSHVWEVISNGGGVRRSPLNGDNPRETCAKVRAAIASVVA